MEFHSQVALLRRIPFSSSAAKDNAVPPFVTPNPTPRQSSGGFRSDSSPRIGNLQYLVIEGSVGSPISQSESLAKYVGKKNGEHGTHAVGMQLGENLPEGITSAPSILNLSEMKVVENTIRETSDRAKEVGAKVETKTLLIIEHQGDVPILVGVQREEWIILPGTDIDIQFVIFKHGLTHKHAR